MTTETFNLIASFCSIASLAFGVWAFFTHIDKALKQLLDRHFSYLSLQQALDMADVYLGAVQSELREHSGNFIRNDLPRIVASQTKNHDEAREFVYTNGDKTIMSHRLKLSRFYLIDRSSIDQFLAKNSPLSLGNIKITKDGVYDVFVDAIDGKILPEVAGTKAGIIMSKGQAQASEVIRQEILRLYHARGDDRA